MRKHVRFRSFWCLLLFFLLMASAVLAAEGRWIVTVLHPEDEQASRIYGIDNGQKVGFVTIDSGSGSKTVAALWKNDSRQWIQLQKEGISSIAYAVDGDQQAGFVAQFGWLWDGGATDGETVLQPETHLIEGAVYTTSLIAGISGGRLAGQVSELPDEPGATSFSRAVIWNDVAEPPSLLHDGDAYSDSAAYGIYGASASSPGYQVGYSEVFDGEANWYSHAALWNGTAAGKVDLNPAVATESGAFAGYGNQQVGYATIDGMDQAILWNGSATDYVKLNPAGSGMSYARSIQGNYQAGYVFLDKDPNGFCRAWLWEGSAEKFVDLHELLPNEYIFSQAWGVEVVDSQVCVVGWAYNYTTAREEAILWELKSFGPMIWANDQSDSIEVVENEGFSITVAFEAGDSEGVAVDWWFYCFDEQNGEYYYINEDGEWTRAYDEIHAIRPFYSGPMFDVQLFTVFEDMVMAKGSYTFTFGVSCPPGGTLEGDILLDEVGVTGK